MPELTTQPGVKRGSAVELEKILGQRKALGLRSEPFSATQAAAIKQIRDNKEYECVTPTWDEFCAKHLRMSRANANRIIRWYEEFGQAYFEVTRFTPISPDEYRTLRPVIVDHRLHLNGQFIALIPEKAEEVASAIAEMRRAARANRPRVAGRKRIASRKRQDGKPAAEV